MNLKPLSKPLLIFTCFLALLTVGAVYLATYSGPYMLGLVGVGVFLAALGGGAAGQNGIGGAGHSEEREMTAGDTGLWAYTRTDTSFRVNLLFYGSGIVLWSVVVLTTLGDTLT